MEARRARRNRAARAIPARKAESTTGWGDFGSPGADGERRMDGEEEVGSTRCGGEEI
jgi:hypothetical protein